MEMGPHDQEDLGLGLKPGDPQYRAYVGPPEDYDLIAAMAFNLLTTLGLRQHHSLLDIGCGSLRIGRLLIPYLNRGKYFGVEPNEWLVDEGIRRELGETLVQIKRPTFFFSDSPNTTFADENRFRVCTSAIDLQSLRTRPDSGLVVCDFAFTGSERSAGRHFLDRGGRFRANGLDLSRLRKLSANYIGTRCQRCESAIRNSRLETSAPDVGAVCSAKVRFELVQGYASLTWNTGLERALSQKIRNG